MNRTMTLIGGEGALVDRRGSGVTIAVIDSGVHPGHPHVGGIRSGIAFDGDGNAHGDVIDRLGHGTAVVSAIHEKAPGASIDVVRVFENELSTTIEALVAAIDWAVRRSARIVNLSLGAANPDNAPVLAAAVARAAAAGTLIVSAREDGIRSWYPGSLPGVVGVLLDSDCPRDRATLMQQGDRVLAQASGYPRPIPGVAPERNLKGISFAVANVTGLLACALEGWEMEGPPMEMLNRVLSVGAVSEDLPMTEAAPGG